MNTLVLDAGALVAVDRGERDTGLRLRAAERRGERVRTKGAVVAQVWRDPRGRQARLARLLRGVDVVPIDLDLGKEAGELLGRTGTSDAIDAMVVLLAETGDRILTSDVADIGRLADAAGRRVLVIPV